MSTHLGGEQRPLRLFVLREPECEGLPRVESLGNEFLRASGRSEVDCMLASNPAGHALICAVHCGTSNSGARQRPRWP